VIVDVDVNVDLIDPVAVHVNVDAPRIAILPVDRRDRRGDARVS
jgi:hypothetical protein